MVTPCCVHDMEAISPICRQLAVSRLYQPLAYDGRSAPPQSTFLKNTKAVHCGHVFATSSPASTCCVWAHLSHLPAAFYPSFLLRTATHSLCRLQRKCLASATFFYLHCTAPPPLLWCGMLLVRCKEKFQSGSPSPAVKQYLNAVKLLHFFSTIYFWLYYSSFVLH